MRKKNKIKNLGAAKRRVAAGVSVARVCRDMGIPYFWLYRELNPPQPTKGKTQCRR